MAVNRKDAGMRRFDAATMDVRERRALQMENSGWLTLTTVLWMRYVEVEDPPCPLCGNVSICRHSPGGDDI